MELYIHYKGNNYTLLINLDSMTFSLMLGMKDVTGEFSQDELAYIRKNWKKLSL